MRSCENRMANSIGVRARLRSRRITTAKMYGGMQNGEMTLDAGMTDLNTMAKCDDRTLPNAEMTDLNTMAKCDDRNCSAAKLHSERIAIAHNCRFVTVTSRKFQELRLNFSWREIRECYW